MKKVTAFISLVLLIAVMVGFAYIMKNGVDEAGSGSVANTKLGLDLAGGVSITYQVVGEEEPSDEDMADTIYKLQKRVEGYSTEAVFRIGNLDVQCTNRLKHNRIRLLQALFECQ